MAVAALHRKAAFPVITVVVVTGSLAVFLLPDAAHWFIYDRDRVLEGQVWRLVTAHAVHFSQSHAAYNLVLVSVVGAWLEQRNRPRYAVLIGLTAVASGLYFLIFMPGMARYGGLSGVVSAAVVYLSLREIRHGRFARAIWVTVLLLFAAKVCYETLIGQAIFTATDAIPFEVVPSAHVIGAVVAIALSCSPVKPFPRSRPCRVV